MVTRLITVFKGYRILKRVFVAGKTKDDICITDLDGNGYRELMGSYKPILNRCFGEAPSQAPNPLSDRERMNLGTAALILRKQQKVRVALGNMFCYLHTAFRMCNITRLKDDGNAVDEVTSPPPPPPHPPPPPPPPPPPSPLPRTPPHPPTPTHV